MVPIIQERFGEGLMVHFICALYGRFQNALQDPLRERD